VRVFKDKWILEADGWRHIPQEIVEKEKHSSKNQKNLLTSKLTGGIILPNLNHY
jgi:hypothetical protein